jgi:hypothetical protein
MIIIVIKSIFIKYVKYLKRQQQIELLSVVRKMSQVTGSSGKFSSKKNPLHAQILSYDDPFLYLCKLFIHFGYHKIAKCIGGFFFIFYLCTFLLQIRFSPDMIITYGASLLIFTNVSKVTQTCNFSDMC